MSPKWSDSHGDRVLRRLESYAFPWLGKLPVTAVKAVDILECLRRLEHQNTPETEFDEAGRMKPSAYYERVVDVMEELVKFTLLTRDVAPHLVDRCSERRESAEELAKRVNIRSI